MSMKQNAIRFLCGFSLSRCFLILAIRASSFRFALAALLRSFARHGNRQFEEGWFL